MRTLGISPTVRRTVLALLVAAAPVFTLLPIAARAQSPELIVDILTTPNRYWNRTVIIKGHVRSVAPNPPGTNRGSYVIRDSSDRDIAVLTRELPAQGREYTVTARVEQISPDEMLPVLREFNRRAGTEFTPVRPRAPQPMPAPPEPAAPSAGQPATQPAAPPAVSAPVVTAPVMTAPPSAPAPSGGVSSDLLVYALVGVVAIFSLVLIVAFWPKQTPAPAPPIRVMMPTVGPQPPVILPATSHPAPPPLMVSNVPPELPTQLAGASRSPAAAKATEIFLDLGAELVVLDGPDRGKHFVLTKPRIGIGRSGSRQNEVTLNDETVSREHARIIYSSSDQSFRLINESSTNPVKVNGNPVESVLLQDEDVIKLGASSLKFKKVWSPAAGSKS